jgi:ribosomal protein S18 acetylase RimI-like enzyme
VPRIRRATLEDAPDLAVVEAAAWQAAYAGILPSRYLRTLQPDSLTRRCRDADMDPGFAGEIYELYVHPRLQGRGLGGDLMAHTWAQLSRQPYRWGVLWVLEDNRRARFFYERTGMVIDRKRRPYSVRGFEVMAVRYAQPLNPIDPLAALLTPRALL